MANRYRMNTAGSMASSVSSVSMPELPNLPGVRRDISLINPKLYREFKASRSQTSIAEEGEFQDYYQDQQRDPYEDDHSLMSYFENSSKVQEFSKLLSPYPSSGRSYNDISGRYSLVSQQQDRQSKTRALPYSRADLIPPFVTNNSKVCSFIAYFTEYTRGGEIDRSRKVEIKFYTEDTSIEINEPRVENSGTWQGKFLKRHQIMKPSSRGKEEGGIAVAGELEDGKNRLLYSLEDFYSGAEITIYNRTYTVIDADPATRRYLDSLGLSFGPALPLPDTIYDPLRRAGVSRATTRTTTRSRGKKAYFEYDRKVLRFYGVWDCRSTLFGDEIKVKLHYSLAENTMEIVPVHDRNSGRDRMTTLLKKSSIMKKTPSQMPLSRSADFSFTAGSSISSPGATAHFAPGTTGTNASNGSEAMIMSPVGGGNNRPITTSTDNMSLSSSVGNLTAAMMEELVPERPYHWTDLRIGEVIPVASMSVLLTDADEFTREFYNSKNMPLEPPIVRPPPVYPSVKTTIPPYNGFGSEEDSLQTCKHTLIPTAPSKDGMKMKLLANMVLRYAATFADPADVDADREFVIQVHLEDDTFQIREPAKRNSGHKGGIFLRRCKLETHDGSKPLEPRDLHLGATVSILKHRFVINDCDQFTFKYMEENKSDWVYSNIRRIVQTKVLPKKEVLQRLILTYPALPTRSLTAKELEELAERAGLGLVKQEVHTLFREVDTYRVGTVKMTQFLKYIIDLK